MLANLLTALDANAIALWLGGLLLALGFRRNRYALIVGVYAIPLFAATATAGILLATALLGLLVTVLPLAGLLLYLLFGERPIGRKRLRESNPIREQVTIAVDGDKVSMTSVAGRTLVHRLGGPAVPWTSDSGKAVQVSVSLVKGRLVQTYTADDGGRRSTWTLDESGDKLTLSVTVTSERLANPLKYALSYRRI